MDKNEAERLVLFKEHNDMPTTISNSDINNINTLDISLINKTRDRPLNELDLNVESFSDFVQSIETLINNKHETSPPTTSQTIAPPKEPHHALLHEAIENSANTNHYRGSSFGIDIAHKPCSLPPTHKPVEPIERVEVNVL